MRSYDDQALRDLLLRGLRLAGLSYNELRRLNRMDVQPDGDCLVVSVTTGVNPRRLRVQSPELVAAHREWMKARFWCRRPSYFTSYGGRLSYDRIAHLLAGMKKPPPAEMPVAADLARAA
jgi:hypothetical protein